MTQPVQLPWWSWKRPLDGKTYFAVGTALMACKFVLDGSLAGLFEQPWSPWSYVLWPIPGQDLSLAFALGSGTVRLAQWLLLLSLPFACAGVWLTWRRLRDALLPTWWVLFFFVPVLNLFFFLILSLARSRQPASCESAGAADRVLAATGRRTVAPFNPRSAGRALAASIPLTMALVVFGVMLLESYGLGLFVGAPFVLGFLAAVFHNEDGRQSLGSCVSVATTAVTTVGVLFLLFAFEGLICLVMAAPIAYPLAVLGACVGYALMHRESDVPSAKITSLALAAALPGLMAAEYAAAPEPPLWEVQTTVEIAASPQIVWRNVVAFPPLPEPNDWLFGTGIAYPQRAEIHGSGVGAVRHCIFSTGAFVEPIDVWDEPRVLKFRVTEQPPPMREWSLYDIHPPHLDHYLVSRAGEFRLEELPDGRTRLVGTTWYTNRMWPANYWRLWSDFIIHRIHGRVLEHIAELSEAK